MQEDWCDISMIYLPHFSVHVQSQHTCVFLLAFLKTNYASAFSFFAAKKYLQMWDICLLDRAQNIHSCDFLSFPFLQSFSFLFIKILMWVLEHSKALRLINDTHCMAHSCAQFAKVRSTQPHPWRWVYSSFKRECHHVWYSDTMITTWRYI